MTQNQIAYHNAREMERHNKMMESETARHQKADEAIRARANAIQATMNYVNAVHLDRSDTEIKRSNLAREYLESASIQETSRHNRAVESITRALNASQIQRNQAEASYATENTKYVQERTKTQKMETALVGAQIGTEKARQNQATSQSYLNYATAGIQESVGVRNYASAVYDISGALNNVGDVVGKLWKLVFGTGATAGGSSPSGTSGGSFEDYMNGTITVEQFAGQ